MRLNPPRRQKFSFPSVSDNSQVGPGFMAHSVATNRDTPTQIQTYILRYGWHHNGAYQQMGATMELTAILCNHAEAQGNLLYISGGGVDRAIVPPNTSAPWSINLGIGINLSVSWNETNMEHIVTVDLVDFDSHPVVVSDGKGKLTPLQVTATFNVGRPPTLEAGESQSLCLAINLPSLPIPKIGNYSFVIKVDGVESRRLSYRVVAGIESGK